MLQRDSAQQMAAARAIAVGLHAHQGWLMGSLFHGVAEAMVEGVGQPGAETIKGTEQSGA